VSSADARLAVIFGPNSGRHDMADMREFADHDPRVADTYENFARWSGIPRDALLHLRPRPDGVSPTRLNALALTAGMLGILGALRARGVHPGVFGGISLAELLTADDARPADPAREEGVGFVFVPEGADAEPYRRASGVRVAVDYGTVRRGRGRLMMLSGRRADLSRLAEHSAQTVDVSEAPYSSAAHHTPLRAHAAAAAASRLRRFDVADPGAPICSGLGRGRTVTTADGVRELLVAVETEPLWVPGMIEQMAARRPARALAIGPFLRRAQLTIPFPVTYVETPDDLDRVTAREPDAGEAGPEAEVGTHHGRKNAHA
jgi:hypothetical protein